MSNQSERFRSIVVGGWISMMLIEIMMSVSDYYLVGLGGDFTDLRWHPGMSGLWLFSILTGIAVLTQMAVRTFSAKPFRWFIFGTTVVWTLFFIFHQYTHLATGGKLGIPTVYDLIHHTVGIWTSAAAFKWAMAAGPAREPSAETPPNAVELRGNDALYSDR